MNTSSIHTISQNIGQQLKHSSGVTYLMDQINSTRKLLPFLMPSLNGDLTFSSDIGTLTSDQTATIGILAALIFQIRQVLVDNLKSIPIPSSTVSGKYLSTISFTDSYGQIHSFVGINFFNGVPSLSSIDKSPISDYFNGTRDFAHQNTNNILNTISSQSTTYTTINNGISYFSSAAVTTDNFINGGITVETGAVGTITNINPGENIPSFTLDNNPVNLLFETSFSTNADIHSSGLLLSLTNVSTGPNPNPTQISIISSTTGQSDSYFCNGSVGNFSSPTGPFNYTLNITDSSGAVYASSTDTISVSSYGINSITPTTGSSSEGFTLSVTGYGFTFGSISFNLGLNQSFYKGTINNLTNTSFTVSYSPGYVPTGSYTAQISSSFPDGGTFFAFYPDNISIDI